MIIQVVTDISKGKLMWISYTPPAKKENIIGSTTLKEKKKECLLKTKFFNGTEDTLYFSTVPVGECEENKYYIFNNDRQIGKIVTKIEKGNGRNKIAYYYDELQIYNRKYKIYDMTLENGKRYLVVYEGNKIVGTIDIQKDKYTLYIIDGRYELVHLIPYWWHKNVYRDPNNINNLITNANKKIRKKFDPEFIKMIKGL